MQMSLKVQKFMALAIFGAGLALIVYPLLKGHGIENGSNSLLAKPTASPEDHPSFNKEVLTSEIDKLEPAN